MKNRIITYNFKIYENSLYIRARKYKKARTI